MEKVLVGVVGYNSINFLEKCLSSVCDQTWNNIDIVYFDNASVDKSAQYVTENFESIRCIKNSDNLGFGPAHNEIIKTSAFDYYLPLNPDVILDRNFITNAVGVFCSHGPKVGAINGLVCYYENSTKSDRIYSCGHLMYRDRRIHDLHRGDLLSEAKVRERNIFGPNGACPVLSKKMIDSLLVNGYFYEPIFFFTGDDVDVSWRMARQGWICLFSPELRAWHAAGSTRKYWNMRIRVEYFANRYLLVLRNDDLFLFLRDFLIIFFVDILYCIVNFFRRPSFLVVVFLSLLKIMKYAPYIIKSRRHNKSKLMWRELDSVFARNYWGRILYLLKNHFVSARRIHVPG
jgi:GT2 family glycosyltransferase